MAVINSSQRILILSYILPLLLSINIQIVNGQEYQNMNFDNGVWHVESFRKSEPGPYTIKTQYYCLGDTIIGDSLYSKLFQSRVIYPWIGYSDTLIKQYMGAIVEYEDRTVGHISPGESTSRIIYDYNLTIGDTIRLEHHSFIVNHIDSVQFCGKYYKRYYETLVPIPIAVTEGIGYSNGPLGYYGFAIGEGENTDELRCYSELSHEDCSECGFIIGIVKHLISTNVYPNPASDYITFELNSSLNPGSQLTIYDNLGRLVYSQEHIFSSQVVHDVSQYGPGLYFYKLQNDVDRNYSSGQFIVE